MYAWLCAAIGHITWRKECKIVHQSGSRWCGRLLLGCVWGGLNETLAYLIYTLACYPGSSAPHVHCVLQNAAALSLVVLRLSWLLCTSVKLAKRDFAISPPRSGAQASSVKPKHWTHSDKGLITGIERFNPWHMEIWLLKNAKWDAWLYGKWGTWIY